MGENVAKEKYNLSVSATFLTPTHAYIKILKCFAVAEAI